MASRHSPRCATLIPNSTCVFASLLASAYGRDPDTTTAQAIKNATRRRMRGSPATISFRTRWSKACATAVIANNPPFRESEVRRFTKRDAKCPPRVDGRAKRDGFAIMDLIGRARHRARLDLFYFQVAPAP